MVPESPTGSKKKKASMTKSPFSLSPNRRNRRKKTPPTPAGSLEAAGFDDDERTSVSFAAFSEVIGGSRGGSDGSDALLLARDHPEHREEEQGLGLTAEQEEVLRDTWKVRVQKPLCFMPPTQMIK